MLPNFADIQLRRNDIPGSTGAARFPLSAAAALGNTPIAVGLPSSGVTPVSAGGTEIHTYSADTNGFEEVYLYACNYDLTANYDITLSFGMGVDAAGTPNIISTSIINLTINSTTGLNLIYPGIPQRSSSIENPLTLYAATSSAGKLNISGYVIRYYPINPDEALVGRAGYSGI